MLWLALGKDTGTGPLFSGVHTPQKRSSERVGPPPGLFTLYPPIQVCAWLTIGLQKYLLHERMEEWVQWGAQIHKGLTSV